MSDSVDMASTVIPKSDQLNADDLIAGPKTITITAVKANPTSAEQPVSVHYEGDNGKPFKPCKSMRRALIMIWGSNGADYVGRALTLYRDNKVTWGGIEVGGIRISHASDIPTDMTFALTESRKKRSIVTVAKLVTKHTLADVSALLIAAGQNEAERRAWVDGLMAGRAIKSLNQAEINQLYDKAATLTAPPEPGSDG